MDTSGWFSCQKNMHFFRKQVRTFYTPISPGYSRKHSPNNGSHRERQPQGINFHLQENSLFGERHQETGCRRHRYAITKGNNIFTNRHDNHESD